MGVRLSRRGWNNVIIIGVILFIAVIQFPDLLRNRQAANEAAGTPALALLLPESAEINRLVLPAHELLREESGAWRSQPPLPDAAQVVAHWQALAGTPVEDALMAQLKPQLTAPRTAEIWLASAQEPIRVTCYQLPQFWLLRNWQGQWLAVTVDEAYLFPASPE
ncbi:hypothetical protein VV869_11035 [Photobacterium sp. MCCC 1A19761]|uniref:hypothetical protein n=1 Tax=Photobacterium sp. MCCC 1A19761 TaxID=3115000 RepID=UPI00307E7A71